MLSRFHKLLKFSAVLIVLLIAAGIGAPYFGADYFKNRIERALESALGRKVTIETTHYSLFTGPGFTIDRVSIEEDPKIGIEPFAYVKEVSARIDLLSALTGKLEFSSLRLVEPEINFARSEDGTWNVQLFLNRTSARNLPPITIRTGHVHVKLGDRKAVIYLGDTDADINHSGDGRVRLSVTGEAYRSDRQSQGLGRFALRGSYLPVASGPGKIDLDFELERSQVQDLVKLFDGRDLGLKGFVESQAHLSGPVDKVVVRGQLKTSEIAARLFLPSGASGALPYEGKVNFINAEAELSSAGASAAAPVAIRFEARNFLSDPDWNAELKLKELAVPAALEIVRNFGLALPSGVDVQGKLQGSLRFNRTEGANGVFELADPVVQLPSGGKLEGAALKFEVHGNGVDLVLHTPASEAVHKLEVEGRYDLDSKTTDVALLSKGSRIAETRKLFGRLPVLEHFADGGWRGTLRYVAPGDAEPAWRGQIEVAQAQADLPGIAEPVTLTFAVSIDGSRAAVRSFRGTAGGIAISGNYRYEPTSARPHRLNVVVPVASLQEMERVFRPTLVRGGGLLARTFRLGRAPVPDWLRERHIEGTISFGTLQVGEWNCKSTQAKIQWNGTAVRFLNVEGTIEDSVVNGEVVVDLTGAGPAYEATGTLSQLAYRGGQLDLKGKIVSQGAGEQVVSNARAEGTFEGSDIRFSSDSLLDKATGTFELVFPGGAPRTKLTNLEVSQGSDTYQGQGGTQADGRLVLDLTSGPKQLKVIGTLLAAPGSQ